MSTWVLRLSERTSRSPQIDKRDDGREVRLLAQWPDKFFKIREKM